MSSFKIKSIKSVKSLKNKTVLMRCDFDTPLRWRRGLTRTNTRTDAEKLIIKDDSRLRACVPTIEYLLKKEARVILMGHLGRPEGKVVPELSLEPVAKHLEKIILAGMRHSRESGNPEIKNRKNSSLNIAFVKNTLEIPPPLALRGRNDNRVVMLENLRFWPGEEKNDKNFAKKLAKLGDIYVNEAFAVSHRASASVAAIKKYLPSFAGLNLAKEATNLSYVLSQPAKPLVVIIGGAKIETKLPVIKQFLKIADYILIGGGVANDFIKALGYEVGKSLVDEDYIDEAREIIKTQKTQKHLPRRTRVKAGKNTKTREYGELVDKIIVPIDVRVRGKKQEARSKELNKIEKNDKILDIGPKTIKLFCDIIKKANTIVWNGPLGYFEDRKFAVGTREIAQAILANKKARRVIGGGETSEAVNHNTLYKIHNTNIFVSSGGGALLEFLGGKKLPGLNGLV